MPAGGAGSVGIGTAWTFRRIVPGGDSMVTRSSNLPLRSMSAAATTVTRLRSVPAGEPAGAVGVGLSTAWEGDGSGATDADVPGDVDGDPSGLDDGARIRRARESGLASGDADGSGPGSTDGSDPGSVEGSGAGACDGSGAPRRTAGPPAAMPGQTDPGRRPGGDHDHAGQQQCGLEHDDAAEEGSPAMRRLRHVDPSRWNAWSGIVTHPSPWGVQSVGIPRPWRSMLTAGRRQSAPWRCSRLEGADRRRPRRPRPRACSPRA